MHRFTLLAVQLLIAVGIAGDADAQTDRGSERFLSSAQTHIVRFSTADPTFELLQGLGAIVHVEDYGPFVFATVAENPVGGRRALLALQLQIVDEERVVGLSGTALDTADPVGMARIFAAIPRHLGSAAITSSASGRELRIVQFAGPLRRSWFAQLVATGARPISPLASNSWIVSVDAEASARFEEFGRSPAVFWVGPYLPWFRLAPPLRALDFTEKEAVAVTIQFLAEFDGDELAAKLEATGARRLKPLEHVLNFVNARFLVPLSLLPAIAAHPGVFAIEPLQTASRCDEAQGQILAGNLSVAGTGPSGPGYLAFLTSHGFAAPGQFNFAIDVEDDGVDRGSLTDVNDEFRVLGVAANASRVVFNNNYTSDTIADGARGHGNINASISGGYNNLAGAPFVDANGLHFGLGICPFVQIGNSKVFNNGGVGEFAEVTETRIGNAWSGGARVSTNSWTYVGGGATYNTDTQSHDAVVRDALAATPGHQPMTIVFAAGNSGWSAGSTTPPSTGKNVISVGASENFRQDGTDGCGVDNSGADNAMDIAGFSSHGPTTDGRKKPDIMAPGTHIQGSASRSLAYNGASVCNGYWPSGQTLYAWSSGTSHATPAIAGAAALVRQWFLNLGLGEPSPAMVKATLMTTARWMSGNGAADTFWSNAQGMGLADLGRAFDATPVARVDQTQLFTATGQTFTYAGTIASALQPVRVGLTWTDPPGPTNGNAWINNLDLTVTVNGVTYLGNVFSGAFSTSGGAADFRNNAEFVELPAGVTGPITVTVTAANILGDGLPNNGDPTDQDFALVIYNCTLACSLPAITAHPASVAVCPGSAINLTTAATSAGTASYQWRKNTTNIVGATAASFVIASAVAADSAAYDCLISNACGAVTTQAAIVAVGIPLATFLPPSNRFVCPGATATFSYNVSGTTPVTFQWRRNQQPIAGATSNSLTITGAGPNDVGSYDCIATNSCGSITSTPATLTLKVPASIAVPPLSQTACVGQVVMMNVVAAGTTPFSYQWRKGGTNIPGATAATYTLSSAGPNSAGSYDCIVTNSCGSTISAPATLGVNTSPSILTSPSTQGVCAGAPVSLSVAANGSPTLTYQWRRNAVPIGGAIAATLGIAAAASTDAGAYDCVVTNGCGSATSAPGVLTVTVGPFIASVTPPTLGLLTAQTGTVMLGVSGLCLDPGAVVWTNGVARPTTWSSPTALTFTLDATVAGTSVPGAVTVNVVNPGGLASNTVAVPIGNTANNLGTFRLQPLAPSPGSGFSIVLEGAVASAPTSVFADFGAPSPVSAWQNPTAGFILDVSPIAGSTGPFIAVVDGLGLTIAPDGTACDASGALILGGLTMPNPPLGVNITLQAIYLDTLSSAGFRLTWARGPIGI